MSKRRQRWWRRKLKDSLWVVLALGVAMVVGTLIGAVWAWTCGCE